MAPKKRATLAEKGKGVGSSVDPDLEQEPAPAEGLARPRRRNRDQIFRDEQVVWEASCKGRGVKAERYIIRDSFPPDNIVIRAVVRQGLSFWFEPNPGCNIELVEEFYKHIVLPEAGTDLDPRADITSKIGKVHVRVTPDIIAKSLHYARPTGETDYPVPNSDFDKDAVFDILYEKKKNGMVPHRPGKFRPSFRFVNQLVCYNLDPRATENKPSKTTGNMLVAFMEEDMVCDWAQYIFIKIIEFRDAATNTRMPFLCLISSICRATEGIAAKYFKNDEVKPGDIDSSILQKSAAHSSGRHGALLTEPPANANTNNLLRKIFCLEVAVAKSQQKLKREVRQIGQNQRTLAHQNQWLFNHITGTGQSSAPYEPPNFPKLEVSDDFAGSGSD